MFAFQVGMNKSSLLALPSSGVKMMYNAFPQALARSPSDYGFRVLCTLPQAGYVSVWIFIVIFNLLFTFLDLNVKWVGIENK